MMRSFEPKELRHRRLVHAARTAMIAAHPTPLQLQRLAELWLSAGLAVILPLTEEI